MGTLPDGRPPLEVWGGPESTVNRVRDTYFGQTERNAHRSDDTDRFADLGIRAIRYPALWAVRAANPAAQLVQTDDLSRAFGTSRPARGRVPEPPPPALVRLAVRPRRSRPPAAGLLEGGRGGRGGSRRVRRRPVPADILGINYYPTSDRYLDEDPAAHPGRPRVDAGSGVEHADIDAARGSLACPVGFAPRLREAWERYRLPLAVTEVHLCGTREERLRWLKEAWDAAVALRAEGADVRAVTAWSPLGSFGWNTLVPHRTSFSE